MNQLIQLDNQTDKQSDQYYSELLSYVRDHLLAFYQKYAGENGLTLSQTMIRVSKWDLEQWEQALDSLGDTSDWPEEAQDRLKIQTYVASINRQQLIGSILTLGVIGLTVKNQRAIEKRVKSDGVDEVVHLKKTLKLPPKQAKKATSVITQVSTRNRWSESLWVDSDKLAGDVQYLVNQNLKHGLSLDDLPNLLEKHANPSQFKPGQSIADRAEQMSYETKRLIRSESARMKQQVDLATYRMKGVKWVKWLTEPGACSKCQGIAAGGPYAIDDVPDIPDDSHPNCRCSIVPAADFDKGMSSQGVGKGTAEHELNYYESNGSVDWKSVNSNLYREKFDKLGLDNQSRDKLVKEVRTILNRRDGSHFESIALMNKRTGEAQIWDSDVAPQMVDSQTGSLMVSYLKQHHGDEFIMFHNHPDGTPPSVGDIRTLSSGRRKGVTQALTVGHDGSVYSYTGSSSKIPNGNPINKLIRAEQKLGYSIDDATDMAYTKLGEKYGFKVRRF